MPDKLRGRVKWFDADKGYGFIRLFNREKDIFIHRSGIADCPRDPVTNRKVLIVGTPVTFDLAKDDATGRIRATNLTIEED